VIADKTIHAVDSKGEAKRFRFAIEAPARIDDVSWGCTLVMEGFTKTPRRIVGEDSWQAMLLAVRLVEQTLFYFVEDGGCLFWEPGGEPMTVGDVVPRFVRDC